MTKEEALKAGVNIAALVLDLTEQVAQTAVRAADFDAMMRRVADSSTSYNRARLRAERLSATIRETREILGARDGESVQDAARRNIKAERKWRPIAELVRNGRIVEIWTGGRIGMSTADFRNPGSISHFREIDPTKPEGVA